jgi:hypothetical protein
LARLQVRASTRTRSMRGANSQYAPTTHEMEVDEP